MSDFLIYIAQNCPENRRDINKVSVDFSLVGNYSVTYSDGTAVIQKELGSASWTSVRVDISPADLILFTISGARLSNPAKISGEFYNISAKCDPTGISDSSDRIAGSSLLGSYHSTGTQTNPDGSSLICDSQLPASTYPYKQTPPPFYALGFAVSGGATPNSPASISAVANGVNISSPESGGGTILTRDLLGAHTFTINETNLGGANPCNLPGSGSAIVSSSGTRTRSWTVTIQ